MKKLLITLAVSLCAICGCGPFWVDPYIAVKQSHLNWVEIHYYKLDRKPVYRTSLLLTGSGHVELKKGTSELISNDFAKRSDSAEWHDIKRQDVTADPNHINDIFQNLVNHGLLDREKSFKKSKDSTFDRFLAVKANICNYTYSERDNILEVDPDLAEQLLDVIYEFDIPTMR